MGIRHSGDEVRRYMKVAKLRGMKKIIDYIDNCERCLLEDEDSNYDLVYIIDVIEWQEKKKEWLGE